MCWWGEALKNVQHTRGRWCSFLIRTWSSWLALTRALGAFQQCWQALIYHPNEEGRSHVMHNLDASMSFIARGCPAILKTLRRFRCSVQIPSTLICGPKNLLMALKHHHVQLNWAGPWVNPKDWTQSHPHPYPWINLAWNNSWLTLDTLVRQDG